MHSVVTRRASLVRFCTRINGPAFSEWRTRLEFKSLTLAANIVHAFSPLRTRGPGGGQQPCRKTGGARDTQPTSPASLVTSRLAQGRQPPESSGTLHCQLAPSIHASERCDSRASPTCRVKRSSAFGMQPSGSKREHTVKGIVFNRLPRSIHRRLAICRWCIVFASQLTHTRLDFEPD